MPARWVPMDDVVGGVLAGNLNNPTTVTGILAASGPVIPDFGEASTCVQDNRLFCPDWVRDNWGPVLQPALLQAEADAEADGVVEAHHRGRRIGELEASPRCRAASRSRGSP